jgi:alpha-L-fucosidase 2
VYPLYPGREITPEKTPELAEACRRSLELRGSESAGWAWRVNIYARLKDAEMAFFFLRKLLRPVSGASGGGCYPNLFAAHPPFQIDANFGARTGIAEMLLQSEEGEITLLPALPKPSIQASPKGLGLAGESLSQWISRTAG